MFLETNENIFIIAGSNVVIEGQDISGLVITQAGEPAILTASASSPEADRQRYLL